ncbi:HSF-type DNA-binding-domain-containing protein, partial [Pelagophyceae sp. CCMP2097]
VAGFVRTLFTLLRVCDPAVISWSDDGAAMVIRDPARFASEVCPKFFRHRNFNSFTRLLNMYQFHKVPGTGRDKSVTFTHAHFRQQCEGRLWLIQRK